MSSRARTVEPGPFAQRAIEQLALLRPAVALGFRPWCTVEAVGADAVPKTGPLLFLSNHGGIYDPLALMLAVGRPIHMLATESVWTEPALAWLMQVTGAVPKRKLVPDVRAIRRLQSWSALGAAVGLFPEGERSWDGQPRDMVPGVAKLVRLLGIPVVTARIVGSHLLWPRWANHIRRGTVRVELDAPRSFPNQSLAEIEHALQSAIQVPLGPPPGPIEGHELASGLEDLLFACPSCFELDALATEDDVASCGYCEAAWLLDIAQVLHGEDGAFPLAAVVERLHDHLRQTVPQLVGTILESERCRVFELGPSGLEERGAGTLVLTASGLELVGTSWSLSLDEIVATTVDLRRRLQFRTRSRAFEVQLRASSVRKWAVLTEILRRAPRERQAPS